ncbi:hypothetical protein ACWDYJ_18065 [Streptomyces sp. NPDC003042]
MQQLSGHAPDRDAPHATFRGIRAHPRPGDPAREAAYWTAYRASPVSPLTTRPA